MLDYSLYLQLQLFDVAVELCMTLEDFGLMRVVSLLSDEESRWFVGMCGGGV